MSASEEEEDYMSSDFLSKLEDVRPGVSKNQKDRRFLKISSNREAAEVTKPKSKTELERSRFEEGINKPICQQSKGFSLLAKMGYKPGMSLGVKRDGGQEGIKEPISIDLRATIGAGIGHDEEERAQQKQRCELHMQSMAKRAKMEEVLAVDFRNRKRLHTVQKQTISDLSKLRKACQELDIRLGRELPLVEWYWPIYRNRGLPDQELDEEAAKDERSKRSRRTEQEDPADGEELATEQEVRYFYGNGKLAPEEIDLNMLGERELAEILTELVHYMRNIHFYCTWCGCAFESMDELISTCPGTSRQEHDE